MARLVVAVLVLTEFSLIGCGGGSSNSDTTRALTPQQAALVRRLPATRPPSHHHTLMQAHNWLLSELEKCANITHTPLREAEELGPPAYRECAKVVIRAAHNAGW
jgi:hypothetical protein